MNKLLTTIILLLLSPLVMAQEKQIWACQGIFDGKTGFNWENGKWVDSLFNEDNLLVTIDGNNSTIKQNGLDTPFECSSYNSYSIGALMSCNGGYAHFLLNLVSGHAGLSKLLGAADPDRESRDSVTASLYECTKF